MPKRVKYRKVQRGSNAGLATTNNKLDFGDYALQTLTRGYITNNQIEAARVAINRHLKRRGKVWIRMFPYRSFTKKPLEVRMGKGKGAVEGWVAPVLPGRVLFEISGCSEAVAHINRYGSHHSDCIVTADEERAAEFLRDVDSAAVYHNVSTRFTDGAEFGMGAEIGISTDKLHARGPMGLEELTTYKYRVTGDGVIRS
jgi:large subunit ribosomal protein L16